MTNRLAHETSPYLLQHQHNPVDWFPWGEEALSRAKRENKPILLSIGYSACHWCHVMERESFENPEIARLMNEHYVCIKVDREERPDLDQIYQNVAQAMTHSGGWPLTVFLTPDLKPYFGGTYFPPDDRYGRPAFPRVLLALSEAFHRQPQDVAENAEKLTEFIRTMARAEIVDPGIAFAQPDAARIEQAGERLLGFVDWENGGVGGAPKFPNAMVFTFLWRLGVVRGHAQAREAVLLTLRKMASGGIYDQLGGGFHRYSVDATWSVPHFEKMLYDNGLLLRLYAEVILSAGDSISAADRELFTQVLIETVGYVRCEMTSPEGGFYSAQDADTEGEEGKFFVWDPAEMRAVLSPEMAKIALMRFGVDEAGNFEHAKTVLHLAKSAEEIAGSTGLSAAEVGRVIDQARAKLLAERGKRVPPGLDHKVLASWNGLMMSGLAWASRALRSVGREEDARQAYAMADRGFRFAETRLSNGEGRLFGSHQGGKGKLNAYLDDYAFLSQAALDLARFEPDAERVRALIARADTWIGAILKHFGDPAAAGYFFTSDDHESLIERPKAFYDQAIPSGTAVALECIAALAEMDWEGRGRQYRDELERQLGRLFPGALRNPQGFGELLCLSLLAAGGPLVVSGKGSEAVRAHPHVYRKPDEDGRAPLLVCHQSACSAPLADVKTADGEIAAKLRLA